MIPRLLRGSPCSAKLDQLPWSVGQAFAGWGVRLGLRATESVDLRPFLSLRPPGTRLIAGPQVHTLYSYVVGGPGDRLGLRRYHVLYENAVVVARAHDPRQFAETFERRARRAIASLSTDPLFVHAGVVTWKGCAILVPGVSLSGKSTLVRELVRLGATYYSDEFAPVAGDGRVRPFLKPLQLRDGQLRETHLEPLALGGPLGRRPARIGLVVCTRFRAGASFRPRRLSPAQTVLELLRNVPCASRLRDQIFAGLGNAVDGAMAIKGTRGEAADAAREILGLAELAAAKAERPTSPLAPPSARSGRSAPARKA